MYVTLPVHFNPRWDLGASPTRVASRDEATCHVPATGLAGGGFGLADGGLRSGADPAHRFHVHLSGDGSTGSARVGRVVWGALRGEGEP